ncbi:MAG: MAPEG family protein [Hyphomicrobiaceae bacterium]|nr:MAPEG family protein [Hyphomicrobiaceae bacterium]
MLSDKQRGVLKGMLAGLATTVAALSMAVLASPGPLLPVSAAAAVAHALRWDLLIIVCLAASIGALARHRFFSPDDIDGGGLAKGTQGAQILQSMLQNTLEQALLAIATHLVWAAMMPWRWQAAIPIAASLFLLGRILFALGYGKGAPARALGFSLTFYPSVVMLAALLVAALIGV